MMQRTGTTKRTSVWLSIDLEEFWFLLVTFPDGSQLLVQWDRISGQCSQEYFACGAKSSEIIPELELLVIIVIPYELVWKTVPDTSESVLSTPRGLSLIKCIMSTANDGMIQTCSDNVKLIRKLQCAV
jgi:hypothetical protein